MNISGFPPFKESCEAALKHYSEWKGTRGRTKRAILAAGDNCGSCVIFFKGTGEDCQKIKDLLDSLD